MAWARQRKTRERNLVPDLRQHISQQLCEARREQQIMSGWVRKILPEDLSANYYVPLKSFKRDLLIYNETFISYFVLQF